MKKIGSLENFQIQETPVTKIAEKIGWDAGYNQLIHQIRLRKSTPYGIYR